MRLVILVLAMISAFFGVAQAGTVSAKDITFGIEVGADLSNYIGSGASSSLPTKFGLAAGGFLNLDLGNNIAIRPEVLYEQKGIGSDRTVELDYIEIPVLLSLSLGTPDINPGIVLGPVFSLNVLAVGLDGRPITDISGTDMGLVGGVQFDINKFVISGRYELGLNDINPNSKALYGTSAQNGTFTFLAGYSFM